MLARFGTRRGVGILACKPAFVPALGPVPSASAEAGKHAGSQARLLAPRRALAAHVNFHDASSESRRGTQECARHLGSFVSVVQVMQIAVLEGFGEINLVAAGAELLPGV